MSYAVTCKWLKVRKNGPSKVLWHTAFKKFEVVNFTWSILEYPEPNVPIKNV